MAKVGKRAPCPCGSGKIYGQCCYRKEQREKLEKRIEEKMKAVEHIESLIEYQDVRRLHGNVLRKITDLKTSQLKKHYFDLPKDEFGNIYDLDTIHFLNDQFYVDLLFYPYKEKANSLLPEILNNHEFSQAECEMLDAINHASIHLMEYHVIDAEKCLLEAVDLLDNKKRFVVTDYSLGLSKDLKKVWMLSRLITYRGITFHTGFSCMISKNKLWLKQLKTRNKEKVLCLKDVLTLFSMSNMTPSELITNHAK